MPGDSRTNAAGPAGRRLRHRYRPGAPDRARRSVDGVARRPRDRRRASDAWRSSRRAGHVARRGGRPGRVTGHRGAPATRPSRAARATQSRERRRTARRRADALGAGSHTPADRRRAGRRRTGLRAHPGNRLRRAAVTHRGSAHRGPAEAPSGDRLPQPRDLRLRRAPRAPGHPGRGYRASREHRDAGRSRAAVVGAREARRGCGDRRGATARLGGPAGGSPARRSHRSAA